MAWMALALPAPLVRPVAAPRRSSFRIQTRAIRRTRRVETEAMAELVTQGSTEEVAAQVATQRPRLLQARRTAWVSAPPPQRALVVRAEQVVRAAHSEQTASAATGAML